MPFRAHAGRPGPGLEAGPDGLRVGMHGEPICDTRAVPWPEHGSGDSKTLSPARPAGRSLGGPGRPLPCRHGRHGPAQGGHPKPLLLGSAVPADPLGRVPACTQPGAARRPGSLTTACGPAGPPRRHRSSTMSEAAQAGGGTRSSGQAYPSDL